MTAKDYLTKEKYEELKKANEGKHDEPIEEEELYELNEYVQS